MKGWKKVRIIGTLAEGADKAAARDIPGFALLEVVMTPQNAEAGQCDDSDSTSHQISSP
jgi:hypothetical protein